MAETLLNPDATSGHNEPPDHGKIVADQMAETYAGEAKEIEALLAEARSMPKEVNDDETMGQLAHLIKRLGDAADRNEAFRVKEKEPHFRSAQAVDRWFFGWIEKCRRQKKTDNPGAADILQARVNDWMQRKLREEQRKRDEAARLAQEEADRIAAEERKATEAAAAALAASQRARKPDNIEQHQAAAAGHAAMAVEAGKASVEAQSRATEAAVAASAKPADKVGTRVANNIKVTMREVYYAEVLDVSKLSMAELWPFVLDEDKAKALKAWAKIMQYKRPMEGAAIGSRPETVVR